MAQPLPVVPDYADRCTTNIVPEILKALDGGENAAWVPAAVQNASRVVLLVVDGLGWHQLQQRLDFATTLATFEGSSITTSVPTTTPVCLTSIITGTTPAQHGIVGFRVSLDDNDVMDVQKWTVDESSVRGRVDPLTFQQSTPFRGADVPAIVRASFIGGGLTDAQFRNGRMVGYQFPSSISERIRLLLDSEDRFVYAYYDGLDVTAHLDGFGALYDAELRHVDRLVEDILQVLPADTTLIVTADHGHVSLDDGYVELAESIVRRCTHLSGEARFRWLHVPAVDRDEVYKQCLDLYGDTAWVRTVDETIEDNWFGGAPNDAVRSRLGDIAIAPFAPLAFTESTSFTKPLVCRHGSLTADEVMVPFIALCT